MARKCLALRLIALSFLCWVLISGTKRDSLNSFDVCVVGAGLSGAVLAERYASTSNASILVLEKRDHIGGNCFDYVDSETGIRVNKYGAHLFHTKHRCVWDYVQRFSEWVPWEHEVVAHVDGKFVPVPVNIDTVNALFNKSISTEIEMVNWLQTERVSPSSGDLHNSEDVALSRVGPRLYNLLFKPYTQKQWSKDPSKLGPSVLSRIPVRPNFDSRYFSDPFQALPRDGYTTMFQRMLSSPQITLRLSTDFFLVRTITAQFIHVYHQNHAHCLQVRHRLRCGTTFYTGPIDRYFAAAGLPK